MSELSWQREPPDSPGDWLWVENLEGTLQVGICKAGPAIDPGLFWICSQLNNLVVLSWNLRSPNSYRNKAKGPTQIWAWAKIELPPRE